MESYRLNSKIVDNGKEFLIQTANDAGSGVIKTSLFENGEFLDTTVLPYSEDISEDKVLNLIKTAHSEKKSELEYLLKSYKEIMQSGQPQMMYHLGTALFYKKMYFEAQQLFRTAIKFRPDYHEAYFFLTQASIYLNHIEDAIDAADKAVDLRPEYADYRNNLGEAFLAGESCKRAVIEFEKAISTNVYYADAYFNLAMAYILNSIKKEDYGLSSDLTSKCMDLIRKAVLIYPDYQNSYYNDAVSALSSGDLKKAYNLLSNIKDEKKEKIRQSKASYFQRFLIYTDWLSEDSINDRIKTFQDELNKNPDYVDLYHDLAVCFLHQSRLCWQKGIEHFQKALELNKDLKKAKKGLDLSKGHYLQLTDILSEIAGEEEA